ncbi:MAG: DUF2127 domain-containing protein [Polyangiales bacterium]
MERPAGLRAIIAYKLIKTPLMLSLALFMTLAPVSTSHLAVRLTHELAGGGAVMRHIGQWVETHVTLTVLSRARVLAWCDGLFTLAEAVLLIRGKSWGEWLVVFGLALACVFELVSFGHRPSLPKSIVFVLNVLIVVYLARRRLSEMRRISVV